MRKPWILVLAGVVVVGLSCSDEPQTEPSFEWEPAGYGEFLLDACGPLPEGGEQAVWSTVDETRRLELSKVEGCAVYRATMEFDDLWWKTSAEVCNRCPSARYVVWADWDMNEVKHNSDGLKVVNVLPNYDHQLQGPVPEGYLGDGLTGFVRFHDDAGRVSLNQCEEPLPGHSTHNYIGATSKQILKARLDSGMSLHSVVTKPPNHFVRDGLNGWSPPTIPHYLEDPTDFRALVKTEYLWPRLRAVPTLRAHNFPHTDCAEIGISTHWAFVYEDPLLEGDGELIVEPGIHEKVPQEFSLDLDREYIETISERTQRVKWFNGDF